MKAASRELVNDMPLSAAVYHMTSLQLKAKFHPRIMHSLAPQKQMSQSTLRHVNRSMCYYDSSNLIIDII